MVGKNYRLTGDMREAATALQLPLANSAFTLRQIFADAPGQSQVVFDMGSKGREAAKRIDAIFREILPEALASQNVVAMKKEEVGKRIGVSKCQIEFHW